MTDTTEAGVAEIVAGLTKAQAKAMLADRSRGDSAYDTRVSRNTLEALYARGLVGRHAKRGSMFSPTTAIDYPLTLLGLAIRAQLERTDND